MIALLAAATLASAPPLVPLLERIRLSVPDAREITDLQVCPPRRISRDGRKFVVDLALNRPREPRHYYIAQWKDGRFVEIADLDAGDRRWYQPGTDPLARLVVQSWERQMEPCHWVSAADLAAAWAEVSQ